MRILLVLAFSATLLRADDGPIARFRMQEIATDLKIGYAVLIHDIDGDGKPDIVVVDKHRVVWYQNPTWKVRTILTGTTKPDNVCVAAMDIDKDGHADLILGADWAPFNTKEGGTLHWLRRGKTLDEEWSIHPIATEPTVHRVRVYDRSGGGDLRILLGPLMGRESSAAKNWADGRPVRMLSFAVPADPVKGPWKAEVVSEELHVVHNFFPVKAGKGEPDTIVTASYDGVHRLSVDAAGKWSAVKLGDGNQANPKGNRGASEVRQGSLGKAGPVVATIEPWHGNQVVTYTPGSTPGAWTRRVIDERLRWGHAVAFADLDGDGIDELIVGVRDDPGKGDTFKDKRGIRAYRVGETVSRQIVDDGGVACEDVAVGDLDGDGRPDIVAVGRATGNVRIYWNLK